MQILEYTLIAALILFSDIPVASEGDWFPGLHGLKFNKKCWTLLNSDCRAV